MLEISWNADKGWAKPLISPLHDLKIHPAAKVLHYAIEVVCRLRLSVSRLVVCAIISDSALFTIFDFPMLTNNVLINN